MKRLMRPVEDRLCRALDHDASWLGVRRLKPAPDQHYTSFTLLKVCLLYGAAMAASSYGVAWLLMRATAPMNPLRDDATWLPRLVLWGSTVAFVMSQCVCMWLWNRRAWRLNPSAFRYRRPPR